MSSNTHGGTRQGAGRPRLGEHPRESITFSVSHETATKARRLRASGFPLNIHIEDLIDQKYTWYFNDPPIAGED